VVKALPRLHGGPDADGALPWDFSTCSNAAGPCPMALSAVRAADPTHYPDPTYTSLRERLAALHGVASERLIVAASASEFIQRITAVAARLGVQHVLVPPHAYGDYAAAAKACKLQVTSDGLPSSRPSLRWIAEPSSPCGQDAAPFDDGLPTVLDAVYAPLRLAGSGAWCAEDRDRAFVLMSPNKALGMVGVRGAYAIAPHDARYELTAWRSALASAEPSWPLGAHAVAMLTAWCDDAVQRWVGQSLQTLGEWKRRLAAVLIERGFEVQPSVTPFMLVRPPRPLAASRLRRHGVAIRDAASFGLPGCWRLSAQPPAALQALAQALDAEGTAPLRAR
jgi:histidinol-phosphate aminotransferase